MNDENNVNEEEVLEKPSMFGMIMNPGVQFERIRQNPKILVAIIIVTILTTIGMFMMTLGMDFANEPGLGTLSEEELMIATVVAQITVVITGLFSPIVAVLIYSAVMLAIARLTHNDVTFKQLLSMNIYIYVISMIGVLVNGLAMMLVGSGDTEILFTSVNSIVGAEGAIGALLNNIEVFTIWGYIITGLGLMMVPKFSKGLSWGIVIAVFVITTGFGMMTAGVGSMMGV